MSAASPVGGKIYVVDSPEHSAHGQLALQWFKYPPMLVDTIKKSDVFNTYDNLTNNFQFLGIAPMYSLKTLPPINPGDPPKEQYVKYRDRVDTLNFYYTEARRMVSEICTLFSSFPSACAEVNEYLGHMTDIIRSYQYYADLLDTSSYSMDGRETIMLPADSPRYHTNKNATMAAAELGLLMFFLLIATKYKQMTENAAATAATAQEDAIRVYLEKMQEHLEKQPTTPDNDMGNPSAAAAAPPAVAGAGAPRSGGRRKSRKHRKSKHSKKTLRRKRRQ